MTAGEKDRLGRGLGALLGSYVEDAPAENELKSVPVRRIVPNPFQPRREFDPAELQELTDSIRQNGLLQPLVVRRAPGGPEQRYQLVAGERRLRAVTNLGWADVSVVVRDVDDETLLILALVENIQRQSLNALEEAEGYQVLMDRFGLTQERVAEVVGKSRSTVANLLRLLTLPPSVRRLLASGQLAMGHARALLGVADGTRAAELARETVKQDWSVREVERRVRVEVGADGAKSRPASAAAPPRDPVVRELEQALQDRLATRVSIRRTRKGSGLVEISFHDMEDFERLFVLLSGREATEILG